MWVINIMRLAIINPAKFFFLGLFTTLCVKYKDNAGSYDEISHDIARLNVPVTLLIDRVGLPGHDGETHEGIFDVAYLNTIPNVVIAMAKDQNEALDLFNFSLNYSYPLALRYPRGSVLKQDNYQIKELKLGEWRLENEGDDTAIITYGPIVNDVLDRFKEHTVVNAIFQKPIDIELLKTLLNKKHIVIYDIYSTEEGFSSIVKEALNHLSYTGKISSLTVPSIFIKHGTISEQIKELGLTLDDLAKLL